MRHRVDVAVVGSGFAGSLTALALTRRGHSVALLERGRHPRFAIGESSTPLAALLVEELAERYDLPRLRPFAKWGTWRAAHPEIGCGLKRGFSFFRHTWDAPFCDDPDRAGQLLVAASPHDAIGDTHWYRPDFDAFWVRECGDAGVLYLDETALARPRRHGERLMLIGVRHGQPLTIDAGFVVDASGPRGFLAHTWPIAEEVPRFLPPTQALFAHFEGVERFDACAPLEAGPPFPVDDAALHHVFDGGWIWVLRFASGRVSAGAALTDALASRLGAARGETAWRELLAHLPSIAAQFRDARAVTPFVHQPRLAYRASQVVGPGVALLPSAVGIVDPLLSTGFPLTLLGIGRLVDALSASADPARRDAALARYAEQTRAELDVTERLVAALYASFCDFPLFKRLALLYFAAASFAETMRRLGRAERAPGFLLCGDARFRVALVGLTERALARPTGAARDALLDDVERAIVPYDVAGLGDRSRRDWFPVEVQDLRDAAPRLGIAPHEIDALVARCGLTTPRPAAPGGAA
ncbi:MAG: FAD-dependent oxidoreductase [Deltaproteobacteria bacterium]|nr:FAD-dependent oxidoreductase [Deltaproteobacteria bacterium]